MTTPSPYEKSLPPNPKRRPKFIKLEITLVSATDLPGRRVPAMHMRRMQVYAVITGDSSSATKKTEAVKIDDEESNPWNLNLTVEHSVPEPTPEQAASRLMVRLYRKRSVGPTSIIGELELDVTRLYRDWLQLSQDAVTCDKEVTPNGKLNISYSFKET